MIPTLFLVLCAACLKPLDTGSPPDTEGDTPVDTGDTDRDGDGWPPGQDCDDADPGVHPGAAETCDGQDQDCDGATDEDVLSLYHGDADGDGFGDPLSSAWACAAPDGYVADATDCDDGDGDTWPGAPETCDGEDDDCDETADEGVTSPFYADEDGDGYGDGATGLEACGPSQGRVADGTDCDDADATTWPGAPERCDAVDNDCDALVDEALVDLWYADGDGDGHGDPSRTTTACDPGPGWVSSGGDCDDTDSAVHPAADETCNHVDDDCDGLADEDALDTVPWFGDLDADGFGDPARETRACDAPAGAVADASDCDDGDGGVHPGAAEVCDDRDQDCDGTVDEDAVDTPTWYPDRDGDGWGDPSGPYAACDGPPAFCAVDGDCDDGDAGVHPGAEERCDGGDQDCDDEVDEAAVDAPTWYPDADGDGYGDPGVAVLACEGPPGHGADGTDCDDGEPGVHPGARETCDGADQDCDGSVDEEPVDGDTFFLDGDADGFGDPASPVVACALAEGLSRLGSDCDDLDPLTWPGSPVWETPGDGVDQDCDGWDGCTDLDCDGLPDIVVPGHQNDSGYETRVGVYYQGDGTWSSADRLWISMDGCRGTAAQDLDGDGFVDLVLASYQDGTSYAMDSAVYWGSATGLSTTSTTLLPSVGASGVTVRDLDRDGWPDILLPGYRDVDTWSVSADIWWGSGAGFDPDRVTSLPTTGVLSHLVEDLDGDGWDDLVLPFYCDVTDFSGEGAIWWGSAEGYDPTRTTALPSTATVAVATADLDGDGWLDLVLVNYADGSSARVDSSIFWGSDEGFSETDTTPLSMEGAREVAIADLDGDGWLDLAFASSDDEGYAPSTSSPIWWGSAEGYGASHTSSLATLGARDVAAADLDGDGWMDLVYANSGSATTTHVSSYVYWGSAAGFSTLDRTDLPTEAAWHVTVADADVDGDLDVLFTNHSTASTGSYAADSRIYLNAGGAFSEALSYGLTGWGPWASLRVVGAP